MSDTSRTTSPKREGTSSPRRRREGRRKGPAVTAIDSDTVGGGGAFLSGASPRSSVASAHRGRGRGEATAATSTAASLGAEALEEYDYYYSSNPRSFPHSVKQQCWEKANRVKGRDPERWRRDVLGNLIFRKLVGCPGCLCHDYDHILPYSKVNLSVLEDT